jgi:FeS assembly SUF system protein
MSKTNLAEQEEPMNPPSREALIEALRTVMDPEIPVNIYDLGLIYRLEIDEQGRVEVDMTLTAPACPVAGTLPKEVGRVIDEVPGVTDTTVKLVWNPPWSQDLMSEEAQFELGLL